MAQRKSIEEQIKSKQAAIAVKQEKVTALQEDISKLKKEVETLQSFEVKAMLKEIDMPFDQVKALLKNLKAAPQGETENKA